MLRRITKNKSHNELGSYTPCRRDFLKKGGAAAAVIAFGVYCSKQVNLGTFPVLEPRGISMGSARLVEDGPFLILRDEEGLYAMSALCTHLGCVIGIDGERFPCPCHGSVFDLNGRVLEGPARRPLAHFRVNIENGMVTVNTAEIVPETTRTPLEL